METASQRGESGSAEARCPGRARGDSSTQSNEQRKSFDAVGGNGHKFLDFARHRRHENEYPYILVNIAVRHVFLHATVARIAVQSAKRAAVLDERRVAARHTVDRYATVRRMPSGDT
jgi:hypothetical protein